MSVGLTDSLKSFHDFVGEKLANGRAMSPEIALSLWRERLREVEAIQEGIDSLNRGETHSADEFLRELDAEFRLNVE